MKYQYFTVDVFTDQRFGGNPLAVVPDAAGLSEAQMQQIAREFNYSESTFVLPASNPQSDAIVRIFTPDTQLPFAGHPNIGTAWVLAMQPEFAAGDSRQITLRFDELAGIVPVTVDFNQKTPTYAELIAPEAFSSNPPLKSSEDIALLADALSLQVSDLVTTSHAPCTASVGLPFHMVQLTTTDALARIKINSGQWSEYTSRSGCFAIHAYTLDTADTGFDVQCRMFATLGDIREDPATGSANCALAGLLATLHPDAGGEFTYRIAQGVEMGRASTLLARVEKTAGVISTIRIGGCAVSVMHGTIEI